VNLSLVTTGLSPPGATTRMSTVVPKVPGGLFTVSRVPVALPVMDVPVAEPNLTPVVPRNPLPVTVTVVPPAGAPADGVMLSTTGGGLTNLKLLAGVAAVVPSGVVTVTTTVPAACGGDTAWIWVADLTTYDLAVVVPKLTCCTVLNPDPVIVTEVPPDVGPLVRDTEVIAG